MSTVRLKRPRGEHKAGELISLHYMVAKEAVAKGEAEYPLGAPTAPGPDEARTTLAVKQAEKLRGDNARLTEENAKLSKENAELKALLESATKTEPKAEPVKTEPVGGFKARGGS